MKKFCVKLVYFRGKINYKELDEKSTKIQGLVY